MNPHITALAQTLERIHHRLDSADLIPSGYIPHPQSDTIVGISSGDTPHMSEIFLHAHTDLTGHGALALMADFKSACTHLMNIQHALLSTPAGALNPTLKLDVRLHCSGKYSVLLAHRDRRTYETSSIPRQRLEEILNAILTGFALAKDTGPVRAWAHRPDMPTFAATSTWNALWTCAALYHPNRIPGLCEGSDTGAHMDLYALHEAHDLLRAGPQPDPL